MNLPLHPASSVPQPEMSFYDAVGGHATFAALVDHFYAGVASDPLLRPMYPEDDLDGAKERLRMFLEQFWGGPKTYGEQRGHPRLRIRHAPFPVTEAARDAWLLHMRAAVESLDLSPAHSTAMLEYFERAAHSLVNTAEGDAAPMAGQRIPDHLT